MAYQNKTKAVRYYEEYSRQQQNMVPSVHLPLYGRAIGTKIFFENGIERNSDLKNNFIEIIFTISGNGLIRLFKQDFSQKPGSVFIYHPGEEHFLQAQSDHWKVYWLTIDGPLALPVLTSYDYPRHIEMPLEFSLPKLDEIAGIITETSPFYIRKTTATIMELFNYPGEEGLKNKLPHEVVRNALRYINDNLSNLALSVNSVADYLGIHRSTFNRLFQREMKVSPHFYIMAQRMSQAKSLLLGSQSTIAQVARSCGFCDDTAFCRLFKQKMFVTPTQYRRNGGGGTFANDGKNATGAFHASRK